LTFSSDKTKVTRQNLISYIFKIMPISLTINSNGFDTSITVKKNIFGVGEICIPGSRHKLKFIDIRLRFWKIILKVTDVVSKVFPSLARIQFAESSYIDSTGIALPYIASISQRQLNNFIELQCRERFSPLGGASPELIRKIKDQMTGNNSYCKSHQNPSIKQFFPLLSNEIGKEASKEYKYALTIQESLREGKNPEDLLIQCIQEGYIDTAQWLLRHEASPSILQLFVPQNESEKDAIEWLKSVVHSPVVTPETIDEAALIRGYGYKAANQMVMKSYAKRINAKLKSCTVKVPAFLQLSDYQMHRYLANTFPDFINLWEKFLDSFDPIQKQQFLDPSNEADKVPIQISQDGLAILQKIQDEIETQFRNFPYFTLQIDEWLKRHSPSYLIIRSTAKEDGKFPNAGANESIPIAEPDLLKISAAIGKTISSYFKKKSILMSLRSGDRSLFTQKKPFIPVLLQNMITESSNGSGNTSEISRSGVLFTREHGKDPNVTIIQVGLGHNEGIVSSQVRADTALIKNKQIHSAISYKPTRFTSTIDNGIYKVAPTTNKNPLLESQPALPNSIIHDLKIIADEMASYYAENNTPRAMDMEFTVKLNSDDAKPEINILQGRELQKPDNAAAVHNFLNAKILTQITDKDLVKARTLLDGQSYVRRITNPSDVIFAENLAKALQLHNEASNAPKAIIIKDGNALVTSHEAVALKPKDVPVFIVANDDHYQFTRKMIANANENQPVFACPQRGYIVTTKDQVQPQILINRGLINYPIPLELTIPDYGLAEGCEIKPEALLKTLNDTELTYQALVNKLSKGQKTPTHNRFNIRNLLDIIATGDTEEASQALAMVLAYMHQCLGRMIKRKSPLNADIKKGMLRLFITAIDLTRKEILPALKKQPQSMERLYPLRFLEAIIFQRPSNNIIEGFSYAELLQHEHTLKTKEISAGEKSLPFNYNTLIMLLANSQAYNDNCARCWDTFTSELSKTKDCNKALDDCVKIVLQMHEMKMTAQWLNLVFYKSWQRNKTCSNRTQLILNELLQYNEESQEALAWVQEQSKELKSREMQISHWANPGFVKNNLERLRKLYLEQFGFGINGQDSFPNRYKKSKLLGRIAQLEFMRNAVDIFDQSIKSAQGSTEYKNIKDKVRDIGSMLEIFFEMMQSSMQMLSAADEEELISVNDGVKTSFARYIHNLKNGVTYHFGFKSKYVSEGFDHIISQIKSDLIDSNFAIQLEARPEFSVDSLAIGSKADLNFSAHWASRLVEYFTTFHRNMEKIRSHLLKQCGLNSLILPKEIQVVCSEITRLFGYGISHVNIDKSATVAVYQIPLRQHSGLIEVQYNLNSPTQKVIVTVKMFGNDEDDRWDQTAEYASILARTKPDISFVYDQPPTINYNSFRREGISFSYNLLNPDQNKTLFSHLHFIFTKLSMSFLKSPQALIEDLKQKGIVKDWTQIDEQVFADSFYLNSHLLDHFDQQSNSEMVIKIAKNSLIGLAKQGVHDYTRGKVCTGLAEYINNPAYKINFKMDPSIKAASSLKICSMLYLIRSLKKNDGSIHAAITDIINNSDIKKNMPECSEMLEKMLRTTKMSN
jgi:hypothetical protein